MAGGSSGSLFRFPASCTCLPHSRRVRCPHKNPRRTAVLKKLDISRAHIAQLSGYYENLKPYLSENNPFTGLVGMFIRMSEGSDESQRAFIIENSEFEKPCRECEAFSNDQMTRFYQLLNWGLMVRGAEFELEQAKASSAPEAVIETILKTKDETEEILKSEADQLERELDYSVIPIKSLVGIQLECGLSLMEYIKEENK